MIIIEAIKRPFRLIDIVLTTIKKSNRFYLAGQMNALLGECNGRRRLAFAADGVQNGFRLAFETRSKVDPAGVDTAVAVCWRLQ